MHIYYFADFNNVSISKRLVLSVYKICIVNLQKLRVPDLLLIRHQR